tara:strand:- start:18 stop:860 length:843 start_codon:yes stop_codon:yes gene_type:complete
MVLEKLKIDFFNELKDVYSSSELEFLFPIFLEDVFEITRGFARDSKTIIPEYRLGKWNQYLEKLKNNIPYQYVLGNTEFFGLHLKLNSSVLIPRPETEELLDYISKLDLSPAKSIADFGTGSGCIALGLKRLFPSAQVWAYDISLDALALAAENAEINGLAVNFEEFDILNIEKQPLEESYELIISNPPYIREMEKVEMEARVLNFEPESALFVDDSNPLIFYKAMEKIASHHLSLTGSMFLEINQYLAKETEMLFKERFWSTKLLKDLSGNWRFLQVWK